MTNLMLSTITNATQSEIAFCHPARHGRLKRREVCGASPPPGKAEPWRGRGVGRVLWASISGDGCALLTGNDSSFATRIRKARCKVQEGQRILDALLPTLLAEAGRASTGKREVNKLFEPCRRIVNSLP